VPERNRCPQTNLYEAMPFRLLGKQIRNDFANEKKRDFGQGGFPGNRVDVTGALGTLPGFLKID
jgi:hypothetical protein